MSASSKWKILSIVFGALFLSISQSTESIATVDADGYPPANCDLSHILEDISGGDDDDWEIIYQGEYATDFRSDGGRDLGFLYD